MTTRFLTARPYQKDVPSLVDKLRPAITELSEQLLRELGVIQRHRGSARLRSLVEMQAPTLVGGDGVSDEARAAAIAPLIGTVASDRSGSETRDPDLSSTTSQD